MRKHHLRIRRQLLVVAVLTATVSFTACKKREAIDLSSLHTSEAVEKETLAATTAASTEVPSDESGARDESKGNPAGSSGGTSGQYSFKTDLKTYTQGNASVQYPTISSMKDSAKEKKVNELLRQNAIGVADAYPLSDGQSLSVKAAIESANLKRITVTYRGELKGSSAAGAASDTERIFYSNTIDLDALTNLRLSDFADAYTIAGYLHSGNYTLESVSGSNEAAVRSYLNSSDRTVEYYYKELSGADFAGGYTDGSAVKYTADSWPKYYSYEKQGVIYVSIPVTKELGSYVIVKYSPDNK